jgi:hypothetical protein
MEIEEYYEELKKLSLYHTQRCSIFVSEEMIMEALILLFSDAYDFEWVGDVWDVDLSSEEVQKRLETFDFSIVSSKVTLDTESIPEHFRIHYKVKIKAAGYVCIIHKNDLDPFPSNPHAHLLELNLKFDLSNGILYRRRKAEGSISTKKLLTIRQAASKVFKGELPELNIKILK